MSNTLQHSTTHPPDIEGLQVLEIPAPADVRALGLSDRIALKLGLWLMQRAQRPSRIPATVSREEAFRIINAGGFTERDAMTLLTFDMQHRLR